MGGFLSAAPCETASMKACLCLIVLALHGCASSIGRPYTPTESVWQQAYCDDWDLMAADLERVNQWAKEVMVECREESQ
jgi:hypothetical protein